MPDPTKIPYLGTYIDMIRNAPEHYINRINTIIDFFQSDCRPSWYVYIQTLLPALGEAVLVLLDYGWDDIARGFLRPYGLRSRRSLRRGKRGRFRLPEIPEIGEEIGKRLPGAQIIRARRIGAAQRLLFTVDMAVQRALWYWLVVDLVTETAYNWATNLMRSEACRHNIAAGFDVYDENQTTGATGQWAVVGLRYGDRGQPPAEWEGSWADFTLPGGWIIAECEWRPYWPLGPVTVDIAISRTPDAGGILDQTTSEPYDPNRRNELVSATRLPHPGRYYVLRRVTGEVGATFTRFDVHGGY